MTERIRWTYKGGLKKLMALCNMWDGFYANMYVPYSAYNKCEAFTWFTVGRGENDVVVEEGDYIERDENGTYSVVKEGKMKCVDCGGWVNEGDVRMHYTTDYGIKDKSKQTTVSYTCITCYNCD